MRDRPGDNIAPKRVTCDTLSDMDSRVVLVGGTARDEKGPDNQDKSDLFHGNSPKHLRLNKILYRQQDLPACRVF